MDHGTDKRRTRHISTGEGRLGVLAGSALDLAESLVRLNASLTRSASNGGLRFVEACLGANEEAVASMLGTARALSHALFRLNRATVDQSERLLLSALDRGRRAGGRAARRSSRAGRTVTL